MPQDKERQISLTIGLLPDPLPVIRFKGREALNEPFRFEMELLGDTALDLETLLHRPARLSMGSGQGCWHGIIDEISSRYLEPRLCHYQVVLVPRLQALARGPRRRAFCDLSVPAILLRLLEAHDLEAADYRFELERGLYPPRALCLQQDENDLQLLNRLCEEEGIHYRFEQTPQRHVLVFAEDPQSFPEQAGTVPCHEGASELGQPFISQLYERHQMLASHDSRLPGHTSAWPPQAADDGAANQANAYGLHAASATPRQRHEQQRSQRILERLRCEQRQIQGYSNLDSLRSGEVRRIGGHPRQALNDQWLITEVQHLGEQSLDPYPVDAFSVEDDDDLHDECFADGYSNHFRAIPWATPFRPSLREKRSTAQGYQIGNVLGPHAGSARPDAQGRLRVQLPNSTHPADSAPGCWVWPGIAEGQAPRVGSRVLIDFVENEPDQPVICGFLSDRDLYAASDPPPLVDGLPGGATAWEAQTSVATPEDDPGEFYLYEQPYEPAPGPTRCLCENIWYVVRMHRPGLKELARLSRDDILLEGRSDRHGAALLSPASRRRLAQELLATPEQLWLLYPGQCVALHEYIQQRWSLLQRQGFLQDGLSDAVVSGTSPRNA
ncbi:type VI secretion system tip protein VgrG [Pseudomonas gingeri]|uniref:type VI secretion system Vgr family protein n=1 Tax=Pseudomonas gingeri TaxID=117681 RepID=UPI0015A48746|nr:type VI secretion system tip protein TssI/VgrG [Pseudomonas gingeri]NWA26035.1 type VI secretion system tip protein VgrG [Pseudomonas gingeri]NWD74365.1 type VI secretion system tip protein VgrG [Pseudomonas gingeri]